MTIQEKYDNFILELNEAKESGASDEELSAMQEKGNRLRLRLIECLNKKDEFNKGFDEYVKAKTIASHFHWINMNIIYGFMGNTEGMLKYKKDTLKKMEEIDKELVAKKKHLEKLLDELLIEGFDFKEGVIEWLK